MASAELIDLVAKDIAKGQSEEEIRAHLQKAGYATEDINGAFAVVRLRNAPAKVIGPVIMPMPTQSVRQKSSGPFNIVATVLFIIVLIVGYKYLNPFIQYAFIKTPTITATTTASNTYRPFAPIPIAYKYTAPAQYYVPSTSVTSSGNANSTDNAIVSLLTNVLNQSSEPAQITSQSTQTVTTSETDTSAPTQTIVPADNNSSDSTPNTTTQPPASSPPPVTPPPATPIAPSGSYPVFAGCDTPATSYTNTLYVDPVNGSDTGDGSQAKPYKTMHTVLTKQELKPDTHVILMPGDHGEINASSYSNATLSNATSGWIWLDFQPGATADYMNIRSMPRWLITNATVNAAPAAGTLVQLSDDSNLVVADSQVYSIKDASNWTADQWINTANNGIISDNSTCVSLLRNHITNVRFGLSVSTRAASADPTQNSIKANVLYNVVKNFSGDGMRPIGSDINMSYNSIIDEYVSEADGDGNHDDGIQGFALNGAIYSNVTIDHNWVQETTNPNRPLNAELQGISSFDGVYENLKVTNNVVIASAYHGISWYGVQNTLIDHNTVINPTDNGHKLWIYVPVGKEGQEPVNVVVSNNTAESISGAATGVTFINNATTTNPVADFTTFDTADNVFNFTPKPGGPIDGFTGGAQGTSPLAIATVQKAPNNPVLAIVKPSKPQSTSNTLVASVWEAIVNLFMRF